jgi:hypothetical protein
VSSRREKARAWIRANPSEAARILSEEAKVSLPVALLQVKLRSDFSNPQPGSEHVKALQVAAPILKNEALVKPDTDLNRAIAEPGGHPLSPALHRAQPGIAAMSSHSPHQPASPAPATARRSARGRARRHAARSTHRPSPTLRNSRTPLASRAQRIGGARRSAAATRCCFAVAGDCAADD